MSFMKDDKLLFNRALDTVEGTNIRLLQSFKDAKELVEAKILKFNISIIKDGVIQAYPQARREKLLREINQAIDALSKETGSLIYSGYEATYSGTYYLGAWELEKAVNTDLNLSRGYALNIPPLDTRIIKQAFNEQIGDYVFRTRAIEVKNRMKYLIQDTVARTLIIGESVQSLSRLLTGINDSFSSGLGNTTRIARTELLKAYSFGQDAVRQEAEASGVEFTYYWDAALDGRTRPTHARADGQKARIVDGSPVFVVGGVAMSSPRVPVTPKGTKQESAEVINCRCRRINAPYGIRPTERAARLPDGEWARVNANTTATEWIKENYGKDYSL